MVRWEKAIGIHRGMLGHVQATFTEDKTYATFMVPCEVVGIGSDATSKKMVEVSPLSGDNTTVWIGADSFFVKAV